MEPLFVKDLDGKVLTVTDLDEAIRQAEEFKDFKHADPIYAELDRQLQAYWNHLYESLLRLKQ